MKLNSKILKTYVVGFSMGSADIVPGVSGGTIAFIAGIYQKLIDSIKQATTETPKLLLKGDIKAAIDSVPWTFLVPLFAGIFTAVITLAQVLAYALETHPTYIWSFFFGLVLASGWLVSKRITAWNPKTTAAMLVAAIFAYILVGAVPMETPATLPMFFVAGMIAICAMILPGISGSFMLLMMGKYQQILEAVNNRDVVIIGTVIVGCAVGLALFSRLLSYLFKHHEQVVMAVLTGFMLGSLRKLWPWKEVISTRINSHGEEVPVVLHNILPAQFDMTVVLALVLSLVGIGIIVGLEKYQEKKDNPKH